MSIPDGYTILHTSAVPQTRMLYHLIESKNSNIQLVDDSTNKVPNAPKLKRFKINAYSGGLIPKLEDIEFPVVFDLATMSKAPNVPLLFNHNPQDIVGHSESITIDKVNGVTAVGVISGIGFRAKEINATAGNQFPWQMSIGQLAGYMEFVKKGETVVVNGRSFVGPLFVARNGVIRELSFCPMGADANTLATLIASLNLKGNVMTFEQWCTDQGIDPTVLTEEQKTVLMVVYNKMVGTPTEPSAEPSAEPVDANGNQTPTVPAPVTPTPGNQTPNQNTGVNAGMSVTQLNATITNHVRQLAVAEQTRLDRIKVLSASYGNPKDKHGRYIQVTAMAEGWTVERTELEMLKAARPHNVLIGGGNQDGSSLFTVLEASICQAGKLPDLEKRFSPQVLDAAHKRFKSRISLQECLLESAWANGYSGSRSFKGENLSQILRAAFSTIDVAGILSNTANKFLMAGFMAVDESWRKIAKITSVSDFKETTTYRGVGAFRFEPVAPDGTIKHGTMDETSYGNKADTYAKMLAITRQDMINDDLGALTDIPRGLGRGGALALVYYFWTEFLDNSSFFHSSNSNTSSGALSITGLNNIFGVFRKLKDEQSDYVMATPKTLLVPVELEPAALALRNSTNVIGASGTITPEANPWAGKFEVVSSPCLSDSAYTGYSTTAYYLLADPNDIPVIEVAFLDGVETPTVETADVDFNRLGIQLRGFFDFGVRKQEKRGGVRSTGA